MRDKWYKIPKIIRNIIGVFILWVLMVLSLSLAIKFADIASLGICGQLNGEAAYAVQTSFK